MRRKNKQQMQSRLLVYKYGTNFPTSFRAHLVPPKMKMCDTTLSIVPHNCLVLQILSTWKAAIKTGAERHPAPV